MHATASSRFIAAGIVLAIFAGASAQEPAGLQQLTSHPAQDGFPAWSPDGRTLVFSRYGYDTEPELTGLWLVSAEGGEPRQLTAYPGEHPDWSPDGRYIAFDGDYGNAIQVVSESGGVPIRIVPESMGVVRRGQPKWSPDGSRVVFKAAGALWLLDVATGRIDSLFSAEGKLGIPACWPPKGNEIFVYLRDAEGPNASIWAVSPTDASRRRVTPETDGVYRYADLSPDGMLLAVVWCEDRNCDIWAMSPQGGPRVPITTDTAYDDGPVWSPDGSRIAFVSTRSGNFDIWVVKVDAEQLQRDLKALTP